MRLNVWLLRLFLAIFVLCGSGVGNVALIYAQDSVTIIHKNGPAMTDDNISGAGVLVSAEGHVLTAAHVLPKGSVVYLRFKFDDQPRMAAIVDRLEEHDLALVKTMEVENLPAPARLGVSFSILSDVRADKIIPVHGIGHPAVQGTRQNYKRYNAEIFEVTKDFHFIMNHQLYGGHSGGPIFDDDNRVIGIAHKTSGSAAGEGLVIPIDYAHPLFEQAGLDAMSDTLQSYRAKIATLSAEIGQLKEERAQDKNALNWLLTFLDWQISICRTGEAEEAGNALRIAYKKRFKEQATPHGKFSILIMPIFGGAIYEEGQGIVEIDARMQFDKNGIAIIDELEEQFERRIERLYEVKPQEEARGKVTLDNINKLRIEIKFKSRDPGLSFATVSLERDYVAQGSLETAQLCE